MAFGWRVLKVAFGAALLASAFAAQATAANWLEKNFYLNGPRYDSVLPPCDVPWALSTIQSRFGEKEGQFWNSALRITDFDRVREVAFRPWANGTIPRRFCTARVLVSDGRWRTVHYSIVEDGGEIGAVSGVDWCVVGVDRNWAYNPACKMAKP
jgi:hypothetical protein